MVIVNLIKHMQDHITCDVNGRTLVTALYRTAGRGHLFLFVNLFFVFFCFFSNSRSFLRD